MTEPTRRWLVSVVGDASATTQSAAWELAHETGRRLVDAGCRVATGGLGGVMAAALAGARTSSRYREGDTLAILPGRDPRDACSEADLVLATGLGVARNTLLANCDGVVAIGGGAGTLSEIALAWQLCRPIVALGTDGWAGRLAGQAVDPRHHRGARVATELYAAPTPERAVVKLLALLPDCTYRPDGP